MTERVLDVEKQEGPSKGEETANESMEGGVSRRQKGINRFSTGWGWVCVSLVLSSTERLPLSPFPAGTFVLRSGTSTPLAPLGHPLFGIFDHWEFKLQLSLLTPSLSLSDTSPCRPLPHRIASLLEYRGIEKDKDSKGKKDVEGEIILSF